MRLHGERVAALKRDTGVEQPRVVGRHGERLGRYVISGDPALGHVERQGNGYAAAARAHVEHAKRAATAEVGLNEGAKLLGLGTRNEHAGAHAEPPPAKAGTGHDILHRLALRQAGGHHVKTGGVGGRHRLNGTAHHVGLRQAETHVEHVVGHGMGLGFAVKGRQHAPQFAVSHAPPSLPSRHARRMSAICLNII